MEQKTRGVKPFFPTITVLLGIEEVLETQTQGGGRAGQIMPILAPTALASASPAHSLPKRIHLLMGFISAEAAQWERPLD